MSLPFRSRSSLLITLLFAGAACSDSPTGTKAGVAAQLDLVAGDAQQGTVGAELPSPLVVKVLDASARPVGNQLVNFRVTAGGGSVFAGSALTNAQGIAQERWTLGTSTQGAQTVEARAVSSTTGAALVFGTFSATARSGPAASIEVLAGNEQSALAGVPLAVAPSVRVRDQYGNAVPGAAVTFAVAPGGGTIANPTQTTDASGIATAGTWTLGSSEGVQTLTAASGPAPAATMSAVARSRTPAQLTVLAGNNQSAVVGAAVAAAPVVLVRNASGDALPGVTVTFAPTPGSGSVTGATVTTDALGRATLGSWTLGTAVGTHRLAVSAGAMSAEIAATATTGAIASLTVITMPPASAEVASTSTFAVRAVDQFGNPVVGAEVAFDATAGGGSVAPATVTTSADGSASATWTLGTATGQNSARARAATLAATVSSAATPGAAARVVKHAGDNQTATVGTAVAVRPAVVVEDRFGNPVPNATVTFVVGAGGGTAGATAVSGADGLAAASQWVLGTTATSNTLLASASGTPAVTFAATARPGPVASLTKAAGDGQTWAVGSPVPVRPSIIARDSYGNAVPGADVTFAVSAGGGTVSGGLVATDAAGVATVGAWTLGDAGAQALDARIDGVPPAVFAATAQARAESRIIPHPSTPTSGRYGDTVAASVIVLDEFGGPVQGVAVTFSNPPSNGFSTVIGPSSITDAQGIARAGGWILRGCYSPSRLSVSATGIADPLVMEATVASDGPMSISSDVGQSFSLNYSIDGNGNLGLPLPRVQDSCGRAVAGVPVTFTTDERSRMDEGDGIDHTDDSGVATKGRWRPSAPGVTTLTVSAVARNGRIFSAQYQTTVYHGAPARLVILEGDGQSGPVGSTLPVAPKLMVVDRAGNAAPRYITPWGIGGTGLPAGQVSIRFVGLDGGTGSATLTVNPDGTVTAPLWKLGPIIGVQSVTASTTSSTYSPIITTTFTANATAPPPQDP